MDSAEHSAGSMENTSGIDEENTKKFAVEAVESGESEPQIVTEQYDENVYVTNYNEYAVKDRSNRLIINVG